ncbi:hypothetical protein HZC27_00095 [Candidatus Roizmanbacteria bacterium]|nr:hypothetical protein [Candidatus Roizmanbacteria bacterium]
MFIVIEGIDGAGCETQAMLLKEKLIDGHPELVSGSQNKMPKQVRHDNVKLIKFPHYDTPVGKMIKDFLYLNQKMSANEQFLLYTLQFIFDSRKIAEATGGTVLGGPDTRATKRALAGKETGTESVASNNILLADRYFTTTLCYQTLEGFSEEYALKYAEQFGIVKPDMVFFLDVTPETAIKWKYGEDKEKNFREKDHEFIKKTYVKYQDLVKRQVWTKWIRINGEQSKEKVTEEILKYLV